MRSICERWRQRSGRRKVWSPEAAAELHRIVKGTAVFYAPRPGRAGAGVGALLGDEIQRLENVDKRPTRTQADIGTRNLRGAHRLFRGVAGSGKSLMLTLNVAHALLDLGPGGRALVCCYNRTLVPFLRQNVEDRHARLTFLPAPGEALTVAHFERVVKALCAAEPALDTGLDFRRADERAAGTCARFDALPEARRRALQYDAVYVDEAQDLRPDEIRLLRRLCRPDAAGRETFIVFYDNAQNIYGVPTPVWKDLGVDIGGRTTYLDQCLRNTRQIVELPFNVLVGSHAAEGERVMTRKFADLQSLRERDLIEERGGLFRTKFAPREGPPPELRLFRDRAAESAGVGELVRGWVQEQRVLPGDVLVLHTSHRHHPTLEAELRRAVGNAGQVRRVDAAHGRNKDLPLIDDGVLPMSTLHSAKGYDAPIVVLVGCDRLQRDKEGRAQFYVGATRAKHRLVLTGVGRPTNHPADGAGSLLPEIVATAAALGVLPATPRAGRC